MTVGAGGVGTFTGVAVIRGTAGGEAGVGSAACPPPHAISFIKPIW
jgi:hypothetical protein